MPASRSSISIPVPYGSERSANPSRICSACSPGRGWPHAAEGEHAEQILEGLADLSEPYGTGIEIEERDAGIVGVVTLD